MRTLRGWMQTSIHCLLTSLSIPVLIKHHSAGCKSTLNGIIQRLPNYACVAVLSEWGVHLIYLEDIHRSSMDTYKTSRGIWPRPAILNGAVIQTSLVASSDSNLAMSSGLCGCRVQQRPFFYSPYQAGIDFSLITEEHKKGRGFLSQMLHKMLLVKKRGHENRAWMQTSITLNLKCSNFTSIRSHLDRYIFIDIKIFLFSKNATLLSIIRNPCVAYGKSIIHYQEKEREQKNK